MTQAYAQRVRARGGISARILLYVYMFYVIYTPPIGTGNALVKFVVLAAVPAVLTINYIVRKDASVWRMVSSRPLLPMLICFFLGSVYIASVILMSTQSISSFDDLRIVQNSVIVLVALNVVFIIDLLKKTGHDRVSSFSVVLWLGAAQGVFAIIGLIVPAIRDISRSLYIIAGGTNEFVLRDRIFGFSSDFTYATQIYHAILAGCALYFLLKEKRHYLVPLILVMATSLLNGRTGLLAFLAMAVVIITLVNLSRFNLPGIAVGIGALVLGGALAFSLLEEHAPVTYQQLMNFFADTEGLLVRNEYTGNYSVLVPELLRVPAGDGVLFGTGVHLYDEASGIRTDIGFTNDLFAGGFIYIVLVYLAFAIFLWKSLKGHPALFAALIVAAVIANLKGEFFRSTTLLFIFIFVALITAYGQPRAARSPDEEAAVIDTPVHSRP